METRSYKYSVKFQSLWPCYKVIMKYKKNQIIHKEINTFPRNSEISLNYFLLQILEKTLYSVSSKAQNSELVYCYIILCFKRAFLKVQIFSDP